jgi:glutamate carboxypeptidase
VLVLSHLDTVHPLRTIEHDLPLRREDDRLYGPGVYDMKGGAYLALQAFKQVAQAGSSRLPVVYMLTADEEIGSPTTRELIEDFGRRSAYVLVMEPARDGGKIVTSAVSTCMWRAARRMPARATRTGAAPSARAPARSCASRT